MTDEASDLEACQMLTINAENLSSTISDALYCTQSASIRVTKETKKKLGLPHIVESDPITAKPSQHRKVSVPQSLINSQ